MEFSRVANEEDQLAQETGLIRRRLDKVEQLSMALNHYGTDLVSQEDRLQGVGWFGEEFARHARMPCMCGGTQRRQHTSCRSPNAGTRDEVLTASVHQAPAKLDRELAALRVELREKEACAWQGAAEAQIPGGAIHCTRCATPAGPANLSVCRSRATSIGECICEQQRRRIAQPVRTIGDKDRPIEARTRSKCTTLS